MNNTQLTHLKFLSETELGQFLELLTRFTPKWPQKALQLKLLLYTGARCDELLSITSQDISYQNRSIFIRGNKGSRSREIPINPKLFQELTDFMLETTRPPDQPIFTVSYFQLRRFWKDLWPPRSPKKLHSLRHTFAIRLYDKTKDIRLVQRALGHKSILNTMIYAEYSYGVEELRKVIG